MLFVTENFAQDRAKSRKISRLILILILISLFVPHTLWYASNISWDRAFYSIALLAVFWTLERQDRYLFSDLHSSTSLQLPSVLFLIPTIMVLVLQAAVIHTQSRFIKGEMSKNATLIIILIAMTCQAAAAGYYAILFIFDSNLVFALPFPIFYILNIVSVYWHRDP